MKAATPVSVPSTVPLRTRIFWGVGSLADNFIFNTLVALGMIIYVDYFGLSPILAGIGIRWSRTFAMMMSCAPAGGGKGCSAR